MVDPGGFGMRIATVASLKGGVGKTTLAVNLAIHLAARGLRVLAVDIDANNNLTDFFLRETDPVTIERANVFHVLTRKAVLSDCIHHAYFNLDVLPATVALNRLAAETHGNPAGLLGFGTALRKTDYDWIVIDSPPYAGPELRSALWASDLILSPVAPVRWIFQGTQYLGEELQATEELTGRRPSVLLVPSMTGASRADIEALEGLRELYPIAQNAIPRVAAIRSATEKGKSLKERSKPWNAFAALTEEIINGKN